MFRVDYDFRLHKYQIVPGGPLTLDEAERCRADKVKGLKVHTENHHRRKVGELHAFLAETFRTLVSVVELGPPDDFYDDYQRVPLRLHHHNQRTVHAARSHASGRLAAGLVPGHHRPRTADGRACKRFRAELRGRRLTSHCLYN